jgi:hypothetical protein
MRDGREITQAQAIHGTRLVSFLALSVVSGGHSSIPRRKKGEGKRSKRKTNPSRESGQKKKTQIKIKIKQEKQEKKNITSSGR